MKPKEVRMQQTEIALEIIDSFALLQFYLYLSLLLLLLHLLQLSAIFATMWVGFDSIFQWVFFSNSQQSPCRIQQMTYSSLFLSFALLISFHSQYGRGLYSFYGKRSFSFFPIGIFATIVNYVEILTCYVSTLVQWFFFLIF